MHGSTSKLEYWMSCYIGPTGIETKTWLDWANQLNATDVMRVCKKDFIFNVAMTESVFVVATNTVDPVLYTTLHCM